MPAYREMLPGIFTIGNLICGFVSLLYAIEGEITAACWFVFLAGFFDALDGRVARLSKTSSQFGIELDSLADAISFGAAPAVIVYTLQLPLLGKVGWTVVCLVYLISVVYRLARYNLLADTVEKRDFVGLPAPMAAQTILAFILMSYHLWDGVTLDKWLVGIIILVSLLMVTQIEFDTIPSNFRKPRERVKLIVLFGAIAVVLIRPMLLLFPVYGLYIFAGVVRDWYRLFKRNGEQEMIESNNTNHNSR
jgi:CDP-diacylglycerol--serine O-phosphatidyltransferase